MTSADDQHESTPVEEPTRTGAEGPQDTAPLGPEGPAGDVAAGEAEGGPGDRESGTTNGAASDVAADLAKAQQDVVTLTSDLQRLQAEYVNYKRRVDRDRELMKQNATFSVLSAMLPVLDDIDRAREHGEVEGGFKAVADSLERIVAGLGLEKFGRPGDEFDPNLHEALMHSHSPDVTTTTCRDIVHAGYRIGERVVRPARVTVVDPLPEDAAPAEAQSAAQSVAESAAESVAESEATSQSGASGDENDDR